jgi:hypothetical protein
LGKFLAALFFITNFYLQYPRISAAFFNQYIRSSSAEITSLLEVQKKMRLITGDLKNQPEKIYILSDYRGIFPASDIDSNIRITASFNNLSTLFGFDSERKYYEYIVLNRDSVGFISQEKFDELTKNSTAEKVKIYQESRIVEQQLFKNHIINNTRYDLLLDEGKIIFFKIKINQNDA